MPSLADPLDLPSGLRLPKRIAKAAMREALGADMARRSPDAKLVVYPNSGHGGIFQHHREFVPEVLAFLADR